MNSPSNILSIKNLYKSFTSPQGQINILNDINVSVKEGEFVVITGSSGSGKTTLLNLIALLDIPTKGHLMFDNHDVSKMNEQLLAQTRKYKIGMVFQNFHLLPYRTALENVIFRFRYIEYDHYEAENKAMETLKRMGVENIAHQPARLLSGGEMQRVAIARAVVLKPLLLLADEPTGNVDQTSAHLIMKIFQQLNEDGITIIMVTHNKDLIKYSSRRLFCENGHINS